MSVHTLRNSAYRSATLIVLGAALVAAAGCGSDSGSSTGQSGGGPGVAKAQALAKEATTRPTSLGITESIGKPVPTGKKVDDRHRRFA